MISLASWRPFLLIIAGGLVLAGFVGFLAVYPFASASEFVPKGQLPAIDPEEQARAYTDYLTELSGSRFRPAEGLTDLEAATAAEICRIFAAQNPEPAERVAAFQWLINRVPDHPGLVLTGWWGTVESVKIDENRDCDVRIRVRPQLTGAYFFSGSAVETWRCSSNAKLTFVKTDPVIVHGMLFR